MTGDFVLISSFTRYARQSVLAEIGVEGQKKLKKASVLCIGAGGLGAPALLYLAAAGIGRIGLVDDDTVDISNLQRQVLFGEADQGRAKVDAARDALAALNSECHLETFNARLNALNAEEILDDFDVVIDGTDNFTAKYLLNDACAKLGKPLVFGSILGFDAQACVFWAGAGPCYRCLYPQAPSGHIANCTEAGVVGAMAGIVGSVQALEAIKMALGLEWCADHGLEPLLGRMWMLDARNMQSRLLRVPKRPHCPICSVPPDEITLQADDFSCSAVRVARINVQEAQGRLNQALFIDVRDAHEVAAGRIQGACHLPLGKILSGDADLSGFSKHAEIIVYCQHGVRSEQAAQRLLAMGFTHIRHLAGGFVGWTGAIASSAQNISSFGPI